jgi:predicted transposase/invertase (TIGR01784 family)
MIPGIDPKVDYAFKWLFGREKSLPVLVHLLNTVLDFSTDDAIVALELLNPLSDKDAEDDKLWIVDIKARDQQGRLFDIEMQMLNQSYFSNRITYYLCGLHQSQLCSGSKYARLSPTYCVCFTNFVLFPDVLDYRLSFGLREHRYGIVFNNDLCVVTLELPKFLLRAEELSSSLDQYQEMDEYDWDLFCRFAEEEEALREPAAAVVELDEPPAEC